MTTRIDDPSPGAAESKAVERGLQRMSTPKGRIVPIAPMRRFVMDLVHFAHKVPTVPVSRVIDLSEVAAARSAHPSRPSWSVLFMKAFAVVAARHAPLRRAYLGFPWTRLYEHPETICALALERSFQGEEGVFVGLFRAAEEQSLAQLQSALENYKRLPVNEIGYFRQAIRYSRVPTPLRRFMWWTTLNFSGWKRAKRFGTFGLSTYGSLGAESLHPISPLTVTLTYGPIDEAGCVTVKLIYDHRVLDGAYIARRLADLEDELHAGILHELRSELGYPKLAEESAA